MTLFKDNAPLCLSLLWEPPPNVEEQTWRHTLGDRVEDAKLYDLIGYFNVYEVSDGRIRFFMHPPMRRSALLKALRDDKKWTTFKRDNPNVELTWAEDVGD